MQKKKNITLLLLFLVLLVWTIIYMNLENRDSGLSFDENKFSIIDTAEVQTIRIKGNTISNELNRGSDYWVVNGRYHMDPSMQKVLMSVLHQVRIRRTVPNNDLERIKDDILSNGYQIEITRKDGTKKILLAGGNGISLSYFMEKDLIPYIVHLPGYESYVTGIFEVREHDWRDRLIFQTSWLGLKDLSLSYMGDPENSIRILAENNLYNVQGVDKIDTTSLMNYLDEISFFYTDQYIDDGQIPSYDSLKNSEPFAHLIVNSLGMEDPVSITFFHKLPGENVMLGLLNDHQMCLFKTQRIQSIFQKKKYFTAQ
jgi:hypothetical protein